jgi:hypothetical protein
MFSTINSVTKGIAMIYTNLSELLAECKTILIAVTLGLLVVAPGLAVAEPSKVSDRKEVSGYSPGVTYPGEYSASALYYRHNSKQSWMRWSKAEKYLQDVVCLPAVNNLGASGYWSGNLDAKGTCGSTVEPAAFAVGNYLNFKAALGR